ncbi:MAG: hypothetical protein DRO95_03170 [Candidatus Altiarchaeales archaeon]|nr:MAG: hypothetical protein DRO95_03170 [Candidatus Altiarchaeales archaeon]
MIPTEILDVLGAKKVLRQLKEAGTIPAGKKETIIDISGNKVIAMGYGQCSDKNAVVEFLVDGTTYSTTAEEAYNMGIDDANPVMPFVTKYDPIDDIYALMWTPVGGQYVRERFQVNITPTVAATYVVIVYYVDL